jgi:Family of unknown function (DUF5706)
MSNESFQATTKESVLPLSNLHQNLNLGVSSNVDQQSALQPGPTSNADSKSQWLFALEAHKYVRELLINADNKSHRYIAFSSAIIIWLSSFKKNLPTQIADWHYFEFLYVAAALGMGACALLSIFAILPRLKGSARGMIYFNSVADFESTSDYAVAVLKLTEQELVIEKLKHVAELSKICRDKFYWLKLAVRVGVVGLIATIVFAVFG